MELTLWLLMSVSALIILIVRQAFVYGHRTRQMPSGGRSQFQFITLLTTMHLRSPDPSVYWEHPSNS